MSSTQHDQLKLQITVADTLTKALEVELERIRYG